MKLTSLFLCATALVPAFAQTSAILAGEGYTVPAPLHVAPGQVVTFFFRGIAALPNGGMRSGQAASAPLPITLAGLSMRISQANSEGSAVPIFAVRQENDCAATEPANQACLLTSVKLQIPFELAADASSTPAAPAQLAFSVDGQPSRVFPLQPVPDNAHVLTSCDLSWDTKAASVCDRQAYHADGTPVTQANPAKGGEVVVVYLFGLGQTSTHVASGDLSPAGVRLTDVPGGRVKAAFGTLVNAPSSLPRLISSDDLNSAGSPIAFGGLTPGQIGIYQLNIPVPQSLDLAGPCGGFDGFIHSNATLRITTSQGTEGLGICIQP